jgi:hypothetical protein
MDQRKEIAVKRLMQAATLALLIMPLFAFPALAAPADAPAVAPAEAPAPAPAPAPALRAVSTNLQDDIFLNGAIPMAGAYWGFCNLSCTRCYSANGCPNDGGLHQTCERICP